MLILRLIGIQHLFQFGSNQLPGINDDGAGIHITHGSGNRALVTGMNQSRNLFVVKQIRQQQFIYRAGSENRIHIHPSLCIQSNCTQKGYFRLRQQIYF